MCSASARKQHHLHGVGGGGGEEGAANDKLVKLVMANVRSSGDTSVTCARVGDAPPALIRLAVADSSGIPVWVQARYASFTRAAELLER